MTRAGADDAAGGDAPPPAPTPRRRRWWRWVMATGLAVVLVAGGAAGLAALAVRDWLRTPLALPDEAVFVVAPGQSVTAVARRLEAAGWLDHPRWLALLARWREDAGRVKAGEYRLEAGLTPPALLDKLVAGDVLLHSVTLVEGWTLREALAAIRGHERVQRSPEAALTPAALAILLERERLAQPCGEECEWHDLEGLLFPDTYRFPTGTADVELLRLAGARLRERLAEVWAARAPDLPLESPYQALVLASIVEKETGLGAERARIAGVFVRRLDRGMRLQSDPTVIYGLGEAYDGDIRRADLRNDTPWNTYTRKGLPPTPIALCGEAALRAAVHPEAGEALYFVATGEGDGSHYFSATLEEHNAAVRRFLERTAERSGQ